MSAVRLRALAFAALLFLLLFTFLRDSLSETVPPDPVLSAAVEVRFPRPNQVGPQILRGGPETALVEAIQASQQSVDMAIYDLDLEAVRDALLQADGRGGGPGSMNYTVNDAYFNDNNLIRLRDSAAAQAYAAEFDEMFNQSRFGALSAPSVEAQGLDLSGGPLQVYFAPEDGVALRVVELIEGAQHSVAFLPFPPPSQEIP